jgi:hypothetical protein
MERAIARGNRREYYGFVVLASQMPDNQISFTCLPDIYINNLFEDNLNFDKGPGPHIS